MGVIDILVEAGVGVRGKRHGMWNSQKVYQEGNCKNRLKNK